MSESSAGLNPLLHSSLPVRIWRERLAAVAAYLYESHFAEWREFEPERKRLDESLSYLEYEGLISLEDSVSKTLQTVFTEIENAGARWSAASRVAEGALGHDKLRDLFRPARGCV